MGDVVDFYLRKSKGMTVQRQLSDLTAAADSENLTVGRTFADPDRSASRYRRREREEFAELVAHIEAGACQIIGIAEASRGSRDLTEWSGFLDLCRSRNVRIFVSAHDRIYDLRRRRDWRALADEGLDAADESEKISERVRSGKRQGARDGRPAGKLQFGFTRRYDEQGNLIRTFDEDGNPIDQVPHSEQGPVVKEIVQRIVDGESCYAISADLNARGILVRSGKPWTGNRLRQVIMSPAYIGRRIYQGQDVGRAAWAPLVDVDLWRRAMAVLSDPKRRVQRGTALVHWISGVILCGKCRKKRLRVLSMGGPGRPRRVACPCGGIAIARDQIEPFIERMILARLSRSDALDALRPSDDAAAAEADAKIAKLNERLEEHYAESAAGNLSARGLAAVEAAILADIAAVERSVRRQGLPAAMRNVDPADVIARWPEMGAAEKREYVLALAELVVMPATRSGKLGFDPMRLASSHWTADPLSWGDHWMKR